MHAAYVRKTCDFPRKKTIIRRKKMVAKTNLTKSYEDQYIKDKTSKFEQANIAGSFNILGRIVIHFTMFRVQTKSAHGYSIINANPETQILI